MVTESGTVFLLQIAPAEAAVATAPLRVIHGNNTIMEDLLRRLPDGFVVLSREERR